MRLSTLSLLSLGLCASTPAIAYDCGNAPDDLKRLEAEKNSTVERAAKGVTAIMPIGIVVHTMAGDEQEALHEMSTDEHNQQIDRRISQIKAECKL